MRHDSSLSLAEAKNQEAVNRLLAQKPSENSEHDDGSANAVPKVGFLAVGKFEDYQALKRGEADETVFGTTANTTLTGAQLKQLGIDDHLYIGIYDENNDPVELLETHPEAVDIPDDVTSFAQRASLLEKTLRPVPGRLDSGRDSRTANRKQRIFAQAMALVCPWPACTTPASQCHIHHVNPSWLHGGKTNMNNLGCCCKPHNSRNDDDPEGSRNGRLVLKDWEFYYQPAGSDQLVPNRNPIMQYASTALLKDSKTHSVTELLELL